MLITNNYMHLEILISAIRSKKNEM